MIDENFHARSLPKYTFGPNEGIGRCFGTFGELVQGALPDQYQRFLVTLPIARYSTAQFTALPGIDRIYVFPNHKIKARQLAKQILDYFEIKSGGILSIQSDLVEGKGCASSSADLVATARAISSAFGVHISSSLLASIMAIIEPSDGVMYQGIVSFYHCQGSLRKWLGHLPPLTIVAVDEGGQVDTVAFNERIDTFTAVELSTYEQLLNDTEEAVILGDLEAIGAMATQSAILNQKVLPKQHLDFMLEMSRRHQALGIVVSHSGTYIGLLLNPCNALYLKQLAALIEQFSQYRLQIEIFRTHETKKGLKDYVF